ncbi:MAG TPA: T9SS type A sorting domain-containing protein, partial [Bacteroidota bacterium]|nr:T9SS type A sorting domain-containing protein [Bacteroidota bacterium]
PPSTACYWRVRGHNTEWSYGPYSPVWRFTTGNFPPPVPIPTFPADGDTGISRTPAFTWIGSPGASQYRIQIARDSLFAQLLADDSTLTGTTFTPASLPARTRCFWRVRAKGVAGSSPFSSVRRFTTGTFVAVEENPDEELPTGLVLHQNYPNPFNPSTAISFQLTAVSKVSLEVFDILGRKVATLVNDVCQPGVHTVRWDGSGSPSGVYFYQLTAAGQRSIKRMTLVK